MLTTLSLFHHCPPARPAKLKYLPTTWINHHVALHSGGFSKPVWQRPSYGATHTRARHTVSSYTLSPANKLPAHCSLHPDPLVQLLETEGRCVRLGDDLHHLVACRRLHKGSHTHLRNLLAQDAACSHGWWARRGHAVVPRPLHHDVALHRPVAQLTQEATWAHNSIVNARPLNLLLGTLLPEEHAPEEVEEVDQLICANAGDQNELLDLVALSKCQQVEGALEVDVEGPQGVCGVRCACRHNHSICATKRLGQCCVLEHIPRHHLQPVTRVTAALEQLVRLGHVPDQGSDRHPLCKKRVDHLPAGPACCPSHQNLVVPQPQLVCVLNRQAAPNHFSMVCSRETRSYRYMSDPRLKTGLCDASHDTAS
mmetsp:Transcript_40238/g.89333  ORF Transcript_40238/g.89333 Transcript_40238/m.89333 type:complete len:368 (+) Transcript_40238:490-1593(+)